MCDSGFYCETEAIRLVSDRSQAMKATANTISPLRQRMLDAMRMRKLAPNTQQHAMFLAAPSARQRCFIDA